MTSLTVLVVEDEWLIGEDLKGTLEELGCTVLGPAPTCAAAIEIMLSSMPDLAYVDIELGSETCEAVLEECERRGVKVVITTGHFASDLPDYARGLPVLSKPFVHGDVQSSLERHRTAD